LSFFVSASVIEWTLSVVQHSELTMTTTPCCRFTMQMPGKNIFRTQLQRRGWGEMGTRTAAVCHPPV